MAEKIKTRQNKNLKSKFRFVVLNDETFEEKFSLILTRTNVWVFLSVVAFALIFLTTAAIIYTPLKYYIPGFGDYNYRSQILQLHFQTDSLQSAMAGRDAWLQNVIDVANGNVDTTRPAKQSGTVDKADIKLNEVRPEEKELRDEVEEDENFSLTAGRGNATVDEIKSMHLIKPVEGYVTDTYNPQKQHFGLDIAAKIDEPVKSVLDGKVIAADYTLESGYVISVQHANNLVSQYKHNSRLLKKIGAVVKGGEVVAVVGNTGETSSGPHLHFELWHEGKSLNPADYIVF